MRSELRTFVSLALLLTALAACSGDSGEGPKAVKWDRDACERCRMVLSDRYSSAQIRYLPPQRKRSRVAMFDDFGCAVLWLQDKPWRDDPRTEFWVTDHRSGEWIDARQATYVTGQMTPMEYGLGAQLEWREGGLSYAQAKHHVMQVEQRFTAQGVQLLEQYREQAKRRRAHRDQHRDEAVLPAIIQE
jgi:copper chaperone NosL